MRLSYWMLGVLTFSVLLGFFFLAWPLFFGVIGFLVGAISLYFDASPIVGEVIISIGTFFWKHYILAILGISGLTLGFLKFTDKVHKSSKYRKLKP